MIAKIAASTASYFAGKKIYSREDIEIYTYGFELLISTILNGLSILLISISMEMILEGMLFVIAFIALRITAGGYHAKHHWSCSLIVNTVFFLFLIMLKYIVHYYVQIYIILTITFSSFIIWMFSPVEACNKPISQQKKELFRKRSIIISVFNICLVILFFCLKFQ